MFIVGLAGSLLGCTDPVEMTWVVPPGIGVLASAEGHDTKLDRYVRPGLGSGTALEAPPEDPFDPALFADGRLVVPWVDAHPPVVATHAGYDAPWLDSGGFDGKPLFGVQAPLQALAAVSGGIDLPPTPIPVAVHPEISVGLLLGIVRSVDAAGLEAHLLVHPTGAAPTGGDEVPALQVLRWSKDALPPCRLLTIRKKSWGEIAPELDPTCKTIAVDTLAAPPLRQHLDWSLPSLLEFKRCTSDSGAATPTTPNLPEVAVGPRVAELDWGIFACSEFVDGHSSMRFRIEIAGGRVTSVDRTSPASEASACAMEKIETWTFTPDVSGAFEWSYGLHCEAAE